MKSPFPGMDPYLESYWGDVHSRMMTYLSDELRSILPSDLRARVEESLSISEEVESGEETQIYYPDIKVVEIAARPRTKKKIPSVGSVAVMEPIIIHRTEPKARSIRIITAADNVLVTTIEVLSPRYKDRSQAALEFRKKQDAILAAGVNLVEIDLLRGGQYAMAMPKIRIKKAYWDCFKIVVQRHKIRETLEFYPVPLDQRLPKIRVPLRATDPDAVLDLQKVINKVYEQSGYDSINYNVPPHPPLDEKFEAWADELLKKSGRRKA